MRSRSLFGTKNILHLIYGLVCLLPMFSILGRVIYTQSNPNALDSYSSQSIYSSIALSTNDTMQNDTLYNIRYKDIPSQNITFTPNYISLTKEDLDLTQAQYDSINEITIWNNGYFSIRYDGGTKYYGDIYNSNFTINMILRISTTINLNLSNALYITQTILMQDKLDNAFEYSISEFTKDNNLGNVDMFSWFTDLFLNQSNPKNALYIGFVNWYLNYTMLVSSGYLFFLVIIWFINFARRILEKSQNQDYGGF